jgi:hypothetical protein
MARNTSQNYNFEHHRSLHQRARPAKKGTDMPTSKHDSQLRYLLKLTRFGVVKWRRTADHNETFAAARKDIFVATVWEDSVRRYFRLESPDGQAQVLVTSADSDVVDALFSEAKSKAFNLYPAIAKIGRLDS